MVLDSTLTRLIQSLRLLPGIGQKSAQRMAFGLLARDRSRQAGIELGESIIHAMRSIQLCERCRHFTTKPLCQICEQERRNASLLCIVESPADILAIEQTGFSGYYFVLHGKLSPLDGLGPNEIGIPLLKQRLQTDGLQEVILATNATVEGEATAHFIAELTRNSGLVCTRLAYGIPMGGELEYVGGDTLAKAFSGRSRVG